MNSPVQNYVLFAAILFGAGSAAAAQDRPLINAITRCRGIPQDVQRLACFDAIKADAANLPGQEPQDERASFGRPRPATALPAEAEEITSTVTRVTPWQRDRVTVALADGSVWRTTESARFDAEVGETVRIRRAALGSYLATFGKGRGVRVIRIR